MALAFEEFKEKMIELEVMYEDDPELMHIQMDELMANTLKSLGYKDGVDIFNKVHKWYA